MADKDVTKEKLPISMVLRHFYKPLLLAMGMRPPAKRSLAI
ncbi:hypothetical protein [Burkholderia multivorans]|nr:hypothetical protein [Burkholderia multivorans]